MLSLTLRQLNIYLADPKRLEQRHQSAQLMMNLQSKAGKQLQQAHLDAAVENLLRGRRWDSTRKAGQ